MLKLFGGKSNWEFVVWYLIDSCVTEKHRYFTRSEIIQKDKDYEGIYKILEICGHKKGPQHMEQTIQKTLQNMRDKNWIKSLGRGDYEVTNDGYKELVAQKNNIDIMRNIPKNQLKTSRNPSQSLEETRFS
jgi:predicted transcriptional regulator